MEYGPSFAQIVQSYLIQLPVLVVWLVGVVVSLVFWRRYPRPALLTLIALVISLANMLVGTYIGMMLPAHMAASGPAAIGMTMLWVSIVRYFLSALAWALVLTAVFIGRNARPAEATADQSDTLI